MRLSTSRSLVPLMQSSPYPLLSRRGCRLDRQVAQSRRDFATEQLDVLCGILVAEMPPLAKEQQMADAAHADGKIPDLLEDVVRRAGEHRIGVHELLYGRAAMVDRIALPVLHDPMCARTSLHDGNVGADRVVAL